MTFPCPKCPGKAETTQSSTIGPATLHSWLCSDCGTSFRTQTYFETESVRLLSQIGKAKALGMSVHPDGGEKFHFEAENCTISYSVRRHLIPDSITVGENYKPGIIEAEAVVDLDIKPSDFKR